MKKRLILISILVLVILISYSVYRYNEYLNDNVMLSEYTYASRSLPEEFDGFKMFIISDLHNAPFSDQIIEKINRSSPDMIAFVGDMTQLPGCDISEAIKIASRFRDEIPVFAVSGNHEKQCSDYSTLYDRFYYLAGITWLEGCSEQIERNGESIYIAGIEDMDYDMFSDEQYSELQNKIIEEKTECPGFTILLSHRAGLYPKIKDLGLDLIISGHLHGGIIRLPFAGGIVQSDGSLGLSEYTEGFVREELSSPMIVSRGCDRNSLKKRWFNQPEVLLITLESE